MLKRLAVMALCLPALAGAAEDAATDEGKVLFETYCSACHTLMLPQSQNLNRANWEWVLDDMVNQFGCNVDAADQKLIIDYLVENHGPNS